MTFDVKAEARALTRCTCWGGKLPPDDDHGPLKGAHYANCITLERGEVLAAIQRAYAAGAQSIIDKLKGPSAEIVTTIIQLGCKEADLHLTCSYPQCSCKAIPNAIVMAMGALAEALKT